MARDPFFITEDFAMKFCKSTCLGFFVVCIASMGILGAAIISGSEKQTAVNKPTLRRLTAKFKGSERTVDQDMETQMVFRPGKKAEMTACVKSGNKTYSLEMTVNSILDDKSTFHVIEAKFIEKLGNAKPQILHHPRVRTVERVPAVVEIRSVDGEGFSFEILIEPID